MFRQRLFGIGTRRGGLAVATTLALTSGLAAPVLAAPQHAVAAATTTVGVDAESVRPPDPATTSVPSGRSRTPALEARQHRFELINTRSDLRADVMWASNEVATGVFLWPDNSSASQLFRQLPSADGWMRLQAVHSDQCLILDWRSGRYGNGTPIVQHTDCRSGYTPGEWRLRSVPQVRKDCGPFGCGISQVLINRRTGRCLDARNPTGKNPRARAVLQQWDCVSGDDAWNIDNQAWHFRDLDAPQPH